MNIKNVSYQHCWRGNKKERNKKPRGQTAWDNGEKEKKNKNKIPLHAPVIMICSLVLRKNVCNQDFQKKNH